ncbi:uncharacterized protein LOC111071572 [Drosophila obscura]|uniref:uncharacterized protein LOC111071572 n=1 Tax=Drosophila obscura TaxID=7282 RepID=UPI001BB21126|nr:uncharacterized protein LOC111071572 [Drosophila obscura]
MKSSSSSVPFKFYFFCGLLLLFAMCSSLCAGMVMGPRPTGKSTEQLSHQQQLEEIYWQTPAVPDERLADAEVDNAYELFNLRPKPTTSNRIQNL